jgi:nitrogen fixation NifU-like protein
VNELHALYRDAIRRHAAHPVGHGREIDATHRHELHNSQCGDRVELMLRVRAGTIEDAAFEGEGCAICMASASLACEHLPGRSDAEARTLYQALRDMLAGRAEADPASPLAPLSGVRPYPSRVRCATLPWEAAKRALQGEPGAA